MTHHLGRLSETPAFTGGYAGHSEGHTRRSLIDRGAGSVHQEVVVAELGPGGSVDLHLHAFEEAFYVLEGRLELTAAGSIEQLAADDYVFVERGVAHALRNESTEPARWFEVSGPQPGAALEDTVFLEGDAPPVEADPPYRKGHFDPADLPAPTSAISGRACTNASCVASRVGYARSSASRKATYAPRATCSATLRAAPGPLRRAVRR